jgi:hypothetical protein
MRQARRHGTIAGVPAVRILLLCVMSLSAVKADKSGLWRKHVIAERFRAHTVVAADFSGDGLPDVISNNADHKQDVLFIAPCWERVVLREGADGVFASGVLDVDGDGDPDFVGARYAPGLLYWLERPARPQSDFWPMHVIDDFAREGINGIHGVTVGDVDRDGVPDVIANSAQPSGRFPNSIVWFRLDRSKRPPSLTRFVFAKEDAPGLSHYMGFGDVNGDGRPDIASAAKVAEGGNWFAWWEAPADPRSVWRRHVIATGQEGATNIEMADVNRDGRADFIASRGHGKGVIWFEAPQWTIHEIAPDLAGPHALAVGDMDGDGDPDAVTCAKDSKVAAWFENDGRGRFRMHVIDRNQAAYDVRLVDLDRDGDLDVLVAGQESRNVVWYENRLRRGAGHRIRTSAGCKTR